MTVLKRNIGCKLDLKCPHLVLLFQVAQLPSYNRVFIWCKAVLNELMHIKISSFLSIFCIIRCRSLYNVWTRRAFNIVWESSVMVVLKLVSSSLRVMWDVFPPEQEQAIANRSDVFWTFTSVLWLARWSKASLLCKLEVELGSSKLCVFVSVVFGMLSFRANGGLGIVWALGLNGVLGEAGMGFDCEESKATFSFESDSRLRCSELRRADFANVEGMFREAERFILFKFTDG